MPHRLVVLIATFATALGLLLPVSALADPRYEVMNAPEGVYWRSEPNWAAAERVSGFGVYNGTIIEVHCYQSGTAVEGSADTMWEQATDVGGRGYGSGWVNEHFINDGQPINQPSPGVGPCNPPPPHEEAPPPPAEESPSSGGLVFPIFNAEGGIYYRNSPHWADTSATPGVGVYDGDQVQLICGAFGDPVGPFNDTAWSYVNNLSRSVGEGWVNEHFIDDGAPDNAFVSGEPMCESNIPGMGQSGGGSTGSGGPVAGSSGGGGGAPPLANAFYDRSAAVSWALQHAKDPQARLAMCSWFVSHALWAGGFPKQPGVWTDQGKYGHTATGTADEWIAPDLKRYLTSGRFSVTYTNISSNLKTNAVPQAEPGDVIFYDWEIHKNEGVTHAAIIVNIAKGSYPEVAEMGQFDFGVIDSLGNIFDHVTSPYEKRGWTWSALHHEWLQKRYPHMKAYLLHINGGYYSASF
jgi:hypothetical protein